MYNVATSLSRLSLASIYNFLALKSIFILFQLLILMQDVILYAAFICLVILRCCRKHLLPKQEEREAEGEQEPQQALVVAGVVVTSQK